MIAPGNLGYRQVKEEPLIDDSWNSSWMDIYNQPAIISDITTGVE